MAQKIRTDWIILRNNYISSLIALFNGDITETQTIEIANRMIVATRSDRSLQLTTAISEPLTVRINDMIRGAKAAIDAMQAG